MMFPRQTAASSTTFDGIGDHCILYEQLDVFVIG